MTQHDKPTIAVIGATGAQGGGLVRAILKDPEHRFRVRVITRDPSSAKARSLMHAGAQVVAGDLDDPALLERAFSGADAAFCVTFYWAHLSPELETAHARNLAKAVKSARVSHVIWSTLEDTRRFVPLTDDRMPTLMGRYKVPHFDAKGAADHSFVELGVPTTHLYTSFYWENLIHFGLGPKRNAEGVLSFTLPMGAAKLPGIASEDIGACALALFAQGPRAIGASVGIAGDHLSGAEMAAALAKALGEPVTHDDVSPEAYRRLGFPGADDLGNMFQFKRDFEPEFRNMRDLERSRALYPKLRTFAAWLEQNAAKIPRS